MNISDFARRAGISPSGVRWYESVGILPRPARRENGYREYSDHDVSRLTLILALRRLGLAPAQAGHLVERCLEGDSTDPALAVTLEQQRRRIAQQREELERLELELVDLERTIAAADPGRRAEPGHDPIGVLFVCNGNSARSQIAEALLGLFGGPEFDAVSGGTRPREVHLLAVRVLAEVGIDWRAARAKSVTELSDRRFDYVVTLSNSAREECPKPGGTAQLAPLASRGSFDGRRAGRASPGGVSRDAHGARRAPTPVHRARAPRGGTAARNRRARAESTGECGRSSGVTPYPDRKESQPCSFPTPSR
jgi:ArsR family transcriptional regulator, arsenate/arsenite/antimonite-responsive transcriptional repressor / arsenate reductase (thioredoxin)